MPRSTAQSKRWCLTHQLSDREEAETIRTRYRRLGRRGKDSRHLTYLRFQEEVASTGQHHFQVYVEFSRKISMAGVKSVFGMGVACFTRRGTQSEANHYCIKPVEGCECIHCAKARRLPNDGLAPVACTGTFGEMAVERGVGRPRGSRAREVGVLVAEGASLADIRVSHPGVALLNPGRIQDAILARMGERKWAMEVEIHVGPTGCGKSTTVIVENPGAGHLPWPKGGRWWMPGYLGQDCIIFDEWRGQLSINQLMKLFDRHPWPDCEAKGRSFQWVSKKVVITTNREPADWFPLISGVLSHSNWTGSGGRSGGQAWRHEELDALRRRIVEFAVIFDYPAGQVWRHDDTSEDPNCGLTFVKVARTREFAFNDTVMPPVHTFNLT